MTAIQVRGYTIVNAAAYLRHVLGEGEANQVMDNVSPGLRQQLAATTPAGWFPVSQVASLYRAIASLGHGDDERAKNELIKCGRFTANEAANTFLKLVMKVLTPSMFAKKLPKLWSRDATGGRFEVDVTEDRISCRLFEMEAFDHIAPISVGYVTFSLEAMGKKVARTELHGWSLANPSAPGAWFELHWK
jgi:hypothetical protein